MLKVCSSALLLSSVPHFIDYIKLIAEDNGVTLTVADNWNVGYRLNEDIIICGSHFLESINREDYDRVRLLLKTDEAVCNFTRKGITHFIFDYQNQKEMSFAFYTEDIVREESLSTILTSINNKRVVTDRYDFDFENGVFKYLGVKVYFSPSERMYLAKWLLLHRKDNTKRVILCRLRKKFGKNFLSDVDNEGYIKD